MISDALLVLTTLLTLFVPGAAVGWSLGLRPWTTLAGAPALTVGLITAAGTAASTTSFPWNPGTFASATVALSAAIVLVRWLWLRRAHDTDRPLFSRLHRPSGADLAIAAGVAVGWLISAATLYRGFGSMANANQEWDNVFHANATRLISDTGDIAPSALRAINDWEVQNSFYPNAFHGLGAIVRDLTGAPVFDVLNAQTMMISGIAGLGLAVLLRALRAPTVVSAATPVLLAGFASFPYDLIWRGPVLPYATGLALIPAFFVLLSDVFASRRTAVGVACGLAAAALLGVQTSIALSAALAAIPLLVQRWVPATRTVRRDLLGLAVVAVSAVLLAAPYATGALSMSGNGAEFDWPAVESFGQSIGDVFLLDHASPAPQYWLAGLMVVGLLTLRRVRYMWWWLGAGAIAVLQFALAASSDSHLVQVLTGPWWNDRWRFAALAVLAFAPLAAAGLLVVTQAADRMLSAVVRPLRGWTRYRVATVSLAGLLAVIVLSNGLYLHTNDARIALRYRTPYHLDQAEVAAMHWLARQPGAYDGKIMNDPTDGSPYMWAIDDLRPVFGHIVSPDNAPGTQQRLLLGHFNCLDSDAQLRHDVQALNIRYVWTGSGYVRPGSTRDVGLVGLATVHSLQPVYTTTHVQIYRVDLTSSLQPPSPACTLPATP